MPHLRDYGYEAGSTPDDESEDRARTTVAAPRDDEHGGAGAPARDEPHCADAYASAASTARS
jgi:hypothetical protein